MQEELVSFESAKLAKEKGFDWNTDYYYRSDCKVYSALYYDSTPNNLTIVDDWMSGDSENKAIKVCTAPTQSLLQKWLREVHNIHIEIRNYQEYQKDNYAYTLNFTKDFKCLEKETKTSMIISRVYYNIYESALETALQEALKFI